LEGSCEKTLIFPEFVIDIAGTLVKKWRRGNKDVVDGYTRCKIIVKSYSNYTYNFSLLLLLIIDKKIMFM
tara:strand:+ start:225 stop:434 length:210 start_codon:yes stop_codon:yes gene_type:complete